MTANQATAWPEGVIARYLTVGGATVDVSEKPTYYDSTDRTSSVAVCTGCDKREVIDWTKDVWSHSLGYFAEETDEGGRITTPKVLEWAQSHAEKCRAMPRPGGDVR